MYHIRGFNLSFNTTKVLYVAEELGIAYEYSSLDLAKGEHKTAEHMLRQPLGKLPTLEHDGRNLFESAAICQYLAAMQDCELYPNNDHFRRALIDQWTYYFSLHIGRWLATLLFERYFRPSFNLGEKNEIAEQEALGFIDTQLQVVEAQLGRSEYIAGDTLSIADCQAFAYIETAELSKLPLDAYPNVIQWLDRYRARPSVQRVHDVIGRQR